MHLFSVDCVICLVCVCVCVLCVCLFVCVCVVCVYVCVFVRPEPIMLFKLPIMLLSNALNFSYYAPMFLIMLYKWDWI